MKQIIQLLKLIALITVSFTCSAKPMIIDHDGALDDVLGMLYLLKQPHIQVKAITIEPAGETHCEAGLKNVQALLNITHHRTIPIACGDETPQPGQHPFPDEIRISADNLMGLTEKLALSNAAHTQAAVNLISETLKKGKEPYDIVALGPLTNLAQVFTLHPDLKSRVRMIYIMGGAVDVRGNVADVSPETKNTTAEWNFFADPVAARDLIRSGVPITLAPLDATNAVPIDNEFFKLLTKQPKSSLAKNIREVYLKNKHGFLNDGWYFWDELTSYLAADDTRGIYQMRKLSVITGPTNIAGTIKADDRASPIRVCVKVSKRHFLRHAMNQILQA